jgi:hypothetical protein
MIVVMLPGTGPDTGTGVVAVAGLPCGVFTHPARNTVKTRVQAQKTRMNDLVIWFHRLPALPGNKKYLLMMTKPVNTPFFMVGDRSPVPGEAVMGCPLSCNRCGLYSPAAHLHPARHPFLILKQYPYSGTRYATKSYPPHCDEP